MTVACESRVRELRECVQNKYGVYQKWGYWVFFLAKKTLVAYRSNDLRDPIRHRRQYRPQQPQLAVFSRRSRQTRTSRVSHPPTVCGVFSPKTSGFDTGINHRNRLATCPSPPASDMRHTSHARLGFRRRLGRARTTDSVRRPRFVSGWISTRTHRGVSCTRKRRMADELIRDRTSFV